MKIAAFGSTYAGAYVFPTYKAADDLTTERPSSLQRVGSTSGAFDFLGTTANPIMPLTIRKSFEIVASTYAGVETALDTARSSLLAANESKLWALMRDGSKRWTYAKVTEFSAPESVGTRQTIPVSVGFECREAIWYAESESTTTKTGIGTATLANAGNMITPVKIVLTSPSTSITAPFVHNQTNASKWTHADMTLGAVLTVDAAAYSALLGSADAYANLTIVDPFTFWLYLSPGNNTVDFNCSSFSGTNPVYVATWYSAWVM